MSPQAATIASPMAARSGTGPAFVDTVSALQYLKRYYKLAIPSNVDNESFSFSNEKLGVEFDAVYTAEDLPASTSPLPAISSTCSPRSRRSGLRRTKSCIPPRACFTTTRPPNEQGLASCWIYRRHGKDGSGATMAVAQAPRYDFRFESSG